jgi:hypothetical protein
MPILTLTDPVPHLHMLFVAATYAVDPPVLLTEPHIVLAADRGSADSAHIRYAAVAALRAGQLRHAPADVPNYLTGAIQAAYRHRGSYKGSRSRLNGFAPGVPLRVYFVFRPAGAVDTVGAVESLGTAGIAPGHAPLPQVQPPVTVR